MSVLPVRWWPAWAAALWIALAAGCGGVGIGGTGTGAAAVIARVDEVSALKLPTIG